MKLFFLKAKMINHTKIKKCLTFQFRVVSILFNPFVDLSCFHWLFSKQWLKTIIVEITKFEHGLRFCIVMMNAHFKVVVSQILVEVEESLVVGYIHSKIALLSIKNLIFI